MDRRIFLKGLLASGALGAAPMAAFARLPGDFVHEARPVVLVAQAGLPQATALARGLAAGLGIRPLAADAHELGSYAGVSAILDRAGRARVIGVMDDASALIFQQIAMARGARLATHTQHRVGAASLVSFALNT